MNKGMLKALSILTILIGVLTFLFAQTRTIDAKEQNGVILKIQNLIYQDALLNESILKSRAGRFSNYDSLTNYKKNIESHIDWFKDPESGLYGSFGGDLDKAINDTEEYFHEKMALTERFKSHNGLLKNSFFYLPTAIESNIENSDNVLYQSDLNDLLREVLLFNSRPNNHNISNANKIIYNLREVGSQDLSQIALHAETVIRERLKLQDYVNHIFSIPTKPSVDKIYQSYSSYSAAKLARASSYRTAMYMMALVLLMYVLYLFMTLRKTMRSLEYSLSELAFQKHALDEHAIVATMNSEGTINYVNEKYNQTSQYSKAEVVGRGITTFDLKNNPVSFFKVMAEKPISGKSWKSETLAQKKDGSHYWVDATIVPFLDDNKNPLQYVALLTDITARKKAEAEQEVVQSELQLAASVFSESPIGIMITDANGEILRVNDAFSNITGFSLLEAVGQSVKILKSDVHDDHFFSQMWNAFADAGQWEGEIWNSRKDGSIYPIWSNITAIYNKDSEISHYINSFADISEKRKIEDRILYLAHHDDLTKLPNRAFFLESVGKAITQASDLGSKVAVLFLDLDNFKMVNDTMGHARGDELLKNVAKKLRSCVGENDIVARLGGDEFTVALLDIQLINQVEDLAKEILAITRESVPFGDKEILVSSSIGISVLPDDGSSVELLLKNADTAMYRAKSDGKSKYQFFHEGLNIVSAERHELENDLRLAIDNNEFELYYQPQLIPDTSEIFGVEALIRWNHPKYGLISPDRFIPELERSGLIIEVGKWVLREALDQLVVWKKLGIHLRMAVNMSSRQLEDDNLTACIRELLDSGLIEPHELELELTESSLMKNPDYSISLLTELSKIGIGLALDDFGTGYSSLSCLKKVPIDTLKIDRSFVRDLSTGQNDKVIATTIIAMARSLGLKVIAEGVETIEQFNFLLDNGCDYVQGYYFSEPVTAHEIELMFADSRATGTGV